MRLKSQLLRLTAEVLCATRIDGFLGRQHRGIGSIFVLHSVVSDRKDYLCDGSRTSVTFLEKIIDYLIAQGIDIVSLDDAVARMELADPRPFACFTFDDGYKDNLSIALPIFERYQAPFTVFVTTCFIERRKDNWWSGLVKVVKKQEQVEVPELGRTLDASSFREKIAAYEEIMSAVTKGLISREGLSYLFKKHNVNLESVIDQDALTIYELRQLATSPLVEIGGHTTNHPRLAQLGLDGVRGEMLGNKLWLETTLDREVRHFAYPYGDAGSCGAREAEIAREVGFRTAVTTRIGNIFESQNQQLHAMPRLRLFNDQESLALIAFQRCGAAGALLTGLGHPVAGV